MAFLEPDVFKAVVRHTPFVAIDLLVRDRDGRLLVGRRRNRPAMGSWFVPGGRINKDERLADAFARLTQAELGSRLSFTQASFRGVFEHFYPDNALDEPGFGTHYVVLAYELRIENHTLLPEAQHSAYRWLSDAEVLADPQVHENTKAYCRTVTP
jgi:colanic acid biosynthesis protein WcaH